MNEAAGPGKRTYVRRQGRMTEAQRRHFALSGDGLVVLPVGVALDVDAAFGRHAPLLVEVGFGMGHALVAFARAHPDWNCLGIDVYRPGIGAVLKVLRDEHVANVRVIEADAVGLLRDHLRGGSIHRLYTFFPDPWPKRRHHKRRLVAAAFAQLAASRLAAGGTWLLATDHEPYAQQMLDVLDAEPMLENVAGRGRFAPRDAERPLTRFEGRGLRLGNVVRDLCFRRVVERRDDAVEVAQAELGGHQAAGTGGGAGGCEQA